MKNLAVDFYKHEVERDGSICLLALLLFSESTLHLHRVEVPFPRVLLPLSLSLSIDRPFLHSYSLAVRVRKWKQRVVKGIKEDEPTNIAAYLAL